MDKLSDFALLRTDGDWQCYKNEIVRNVSGGLEENNLFNSPSNFKFPSGPDSFPCLVASLIIAEGSGGVEEISVYKVNCCYVYPEDAENLMKFVTIPKPLNQETETKASTQVSIRSQDRMKHLLALIIGVTLELEDIGALKKEKLLESIRNAYQGLPDDCDDFLVTFTSTINGK